MRLLNTKTGQFYEIGDPSKARYATLSHVWCKDGEMLYQDVERIRLEQHRGVAGDNLERSPSLLPLLSPKIRNACALALSDGISHIWIDTCCIDKTSSAELSEAINSMYTWYAQSTVCYAYLEDAMYRNSSDGRMYTVENRGELARPSISECKWFKRGWTLQELIAPPFLVFVGADWQPFGTKDSYVETITAITRVPRDVLRHVVPADAYSVATRMSWASARTCTRVEDQAYSLMGIFDVHMPTIYGEGDHAFRRLQEEILKQDPDQSILVWGSVDIFVDWSAFIKHTQNSTSHRDVFGLKEPLATSPRAFGQSAALLRGILTTLTPHQLAERIGQPSEREAPWPDIVVTPVGINTRAPIVPLPSVDPSRPLYAAFLACEYHSRFDDDIRPRALPALLLSPMDAKRASYAGATKDAMKGRPHFYPVGEVCLVPPPVPMFAQFDDICLGFPHTSRLKRYHPLPSDDAPQLTDRRGIISPGFRVSLAPKASEHAWAHYEFSGDTILDGGSWADGSVRRKLPPTHSLLFVSRKDSDDQIIIRLGPSNDPSLNSSGQPSVIPSNSALSPGLRTSYSEGDRLSSRPLRAIISRTCSCGRQTSDAEVLSPLAGLNAQSQAIVCIPAMDINATASRPTSLEPHTDAVASWEQVDDVSFTREFVCGCTSGPVLRIILSIQSWFPSMHPPFYSDTYRLGVVINPPQHSTEERSVVLDMELFNAELRSRRRLVSRRIQHVQAPAHQDHDDEMQG